MRTERRKSPRFTINQLIDLEPGRENYIAAEGVNISNEGLLCHTSDSLDLYSRVYLQFSLNGEKKNHTIKCEGVVVRCKKNKKNFDTALEFADMDNGDKKKLLAFLH
jgi:c-di-GMP-binding flagellar brake protein YcgR